MIIELAANDSIVASDRIVQYGDGCFTTMAVSGGEAELFSGHIQRLQLSCEKLFIPFDEWQSLQSKIKQIAQGVGNGGIKVIISRGKGGRGYSPQGAGEALCYLSTFSAPEHYQSWRKNGISLSLSPVTLAKQPLLAGIKHLNRLEQVLVKYHMQDSNSDDVIVCDTDGIMIETSAGNLIWEHDQQWFTPDLSQSGVAGVMCNAMMAFLQANNQIVQQIRVKPEALFSAQQLYICNSLMGVVPVISLSHEERQKSWKIDTLNAFKHMNVGVE